MVVQLSIVVGNAAELIGLGHTHIEIHQSTDQGNSFQEITAATAQAAILDSAIALTTFQMGGKLLKLKINGGVEQSISFGSVLDRWTPSQVVSRINEVIPGLASVLEGTKVRLTSSTTGRASSLEVTYCDAYELGWFGGEIKYGLSARVALNGSTLLYSFPDVAGKTTDRYKWRFSANGSSPVSDFSAVVKGQTQPVLNPASLSVGTAKFYDATGRPVACRVLVTLQSVPQSLSGAFITNDQTLSFDADDSGFVAITFVRGAKVKVAIEGTGYVREFIVPDSTTFDILTIMSTATDPFTVQTLAPLLIRRSI